MLRITIPAIEQYDEEKNEFISTQECVLQLEHSLISLSKWESRWCKPLLSKDTKTSEESIDYVRCMTLTENVDDNCYLGLTKDHNKQITDYMALPMTATVFSKGNESPSRKIITSEIIYYWMIAMNIPFECQGWHLNRLLTLINVCNIKNTPSKKMKKKELLSRNTDINAARKIALNTKG